MDRGASAGWVAEASRQKSQPFHLYELHLDSGTIYATDAPRDIIWNGNTYLAVAHFIEHSAIEETAELKVTRCTVTLSGVDQSMISVVLNENTIDRRLKIYKGFLYEGGFILLESGGGDHLLTEAGDYLAEEDAA